MKTLSQEAEIIAMANALRLVGDPVESIIDFCRQKIARWIDGPRSIRTIWDLEKIICEKLNLVIHEVWNDDDLEELIRNYVEEGEIVFAHLKADLDAKTFATLIRRKALRPNSEDRYVAVIDCRGNKGARRFFSRWHEIAHLLTLYKQMELPFHRSTIDRDPTEKLMDIIAGEIGFYDTLFRPALEAELRSQGRLTLDAVERVRREYCPDASFQATLNACAARAPAPVIVLEIGMGYKKSELRELHLAQLPLIPPKLPQPKLRVLSAVPNAAARKISFQIPRYMRVPVASIITGVFDNGTGLSIGATETVENLNQWTSSNGSRLPNVKVDVQALKTGEHVLVIVSPVADSVGVRA